MAKNNPGDGASVLPTPAASVIGQAVVTQPESKTNNPENAKAVAELEQSSCLFKLKTAAVPIVWIVAEDEMRFVSTELATFKALQKPYDFFLFDATGGLYTLNNTTGSKKFMHQFNTDTSALIRWFGRPDIKDGGDKKSKEAADEEMRMYGPANSLKPAKDRSTLILFDVAMRLHDHQNTGWINPGLTREIKNIVNDLITSSKTLVIVSHLSKIPSELQAVCTIAYHEKPSVEQLLKKVEKIAEIPVGTYGSIKISKQDALLIAEKLSGMHAIEAENTLTLANLENARECQRGLTTNRGFNIELIDNEKSQCIRKLGTMEMMKPPGTIDDVGGFDILKKWFDSRMHLFSKEAMERGINKPKGIVLTGPGGTGKTYLSMCLGATWKRMVVRVDVGACKGSLVGQSEERMRQALSMLDHQNEVIAFFDEFEKMFAGIGSSGFSDGGTTMNMYQTWLNWSQNRKSNVFTIAACNSVQGIPAPAFRRGRFDQVFFVDLPSPSERLEIFNIHMRKRKWNIGDVKDLDVKHISSMTRNFVASEIEEFVNSALIIQFNEELSKHCGKRELLMKHFKESAASIVPSYDTNREEIEGMRAWAKNTGVMWVSSKQNEQEDEVSVSSLAVGDAVTRTLGFDNDDDTIK